MRGEPSYQPASAVICEDNVPHPVDRHSRVRVVVVEQLLDGVTAPGHRIVVKGVCR